MEHDEDGTMFRFRLGQGVRWAAFPQTHYTIYQRRWTDHEMLAPIVQYRLRISRAGWRACGLNENWVYEADLEAWESVMTPHGEAEG